MTLTLRNKLSLMKVKSIVNTVLIILRIIENNINLSQFKMCIEVIP